MNESILVIGAGVAGMRAAVELLQQKFTVYLVEKEAQIGGKLAKIERMFPTNEHAACAIQPLILDLLYNPNATIFTSAELLTLQGQPGDLKAEVQQAPAASKEDPQSVELSVGAVIVATGLQEDKGESLARLGYGKFSNVCTGLELEQQLSGLGPTGGVVKLSPGKEPERLTWIVLDETSPVSFLSASAEAGSVLEKNQNAEAYILYENRPIISKDNAEFCQEAKNRGVKYLQGKAVEVSESPAGNLTLSYTDDSGKPNQLESDLLVLSVPLTPGENTQIMAKRLGLELDEKGYFKQDPNIDHPLFTTRNGVFMCGSSSKANGIGESVIQACAAASHAATLLAPIRGNGVTESADKNLLPVKFEHEPEIAVVIDKGGNEIADLLDFEAIAEYTRALPGVNRVEVMPYSFDGSKIHELLGTGEFNRLIVAGPSPIPHETLFQQHTEHAGLNRYLMEMVNLHEQCARVHATDKKEATEKAKRLMNMGVARARQLEPLEEVEVHIKQNCLVIGSDAAGAACAVRLAEMGIHVYLIASEANLTEIKENDHPLVKSFAAALAANQNVELLAPAILEDVQGSFGDFKVNLVKNRTKMILEVGAIVLATSTSDAVRSDQSHFEESLALEKDQNGYYISTQGILNLLDFTTAGVFNCGTARASMKIEDAVMEGEAAASRAACILASSIIKRPPMISQVIEANCDGCAYCVEPCPTRSITLLEFMQRGSIKKVVEVNDSTCIGCGICMATCPKKGIQVRHFKPEYFTEMVNAALDDNENQPVIISFCCNRCAYPGVDAAGSAGIQYPANVLIIRTVCTGMIHPNIIIDALTHGADGVLLCGCHPGNCRSREGIRKAQARAEAIELMLEDFGLETERFRLELIAASEGQKFARIAEEMTSELLTLGPSPYK